MNIPEEFGKYLLLKKLSEDPLGETFRAGRVGKEGMEQILLLRVFNGKGVDGERLWQKASSRAAVQQSLKSPNIGSGVDLGRVRSFPYAAYDYISGKNLSALLAQANRQMSPVPPDHALLIAERISLALAAAYETRVQDERILHGFVVPQLVMISNEGETRLLGFEAGAGLLSLAAAGWRDANVQSYVSPEALAGAALTKADDVYSLGAILYEMLTGERLPATSADGHAALIDTALLPGEDTPLPAELAALLKKSLCARDQRIADAATWHKTASKLMIDLHYNATTFNLAFFMHNLFRDEIERESQEMQAEKKLELKKAPEPVAVAPAAAAGGRETREVTQVRTDATLSGTQSRMAQPKSKTPIYIGLAAGVLVAAAGAYFLVLRPSEPAQTAAASPPPMSVPAAQTAVMPSTEPVAPVQTGPTPEELQAQIQSMIAAQSQEVENKLKDQYDNRIKQLQEQLESSRRAQQMEQDRPRQQPEPKPVQPVETPEPAPVEKVAKQEPPPPVVPAAQPAVEREPQRIVPEPTPVPAAPVQAPQVRKTQPGDLVQAGPGVTAPKLTSRIDPRYPASAQKLNKAATVDIRVLVDERGKVLETQRAGAKAGFGFDEAAMDAARRASFSPAMKDGVRVKMWYTLRVSFQPVR